MPAVVNMQFYGNSTQVEAMLDRMNTAINPVALASFLGVKVDPYMRGRIAQRFAQEGDDVTGKWHPLSQATQDIRSNLGYGAAHPINRRTGDLQDFITGTPNSLVSDAVGATLKMPGDLPTNPETLKKFERAQKGDPRTPARPVIGMNEQDLAWVLEALALSITHGVP